MKFPTFLQKTIDFSSFWSHDPAKSLIFVPESRAATHLSKIDEIWPKNTDRLFDQTKVLVYVASSEKYVKSSFK